MAGAFTIDSFRLLKGTNPARILLIPFGDRNYRFSLNRFLLGVAAALATLCVQPALAGTTTVWDTTLNFAYSGNSPTTYSAPGFAGPTTGDYIGASFNTTKLEFTLGAGSVRFKYYTGFDGNESTARYADIFFALNSNPTHPPAAWTYGISLGTAADNFQGAAAKGLYALGGASDYKTSRDIWGPKSGYIYGGGYIAPDGTQNLSPTQVTGGNLMAGWTVGASSYSDGSGGYIVDVILNAPSTLAFASVFNQSWLDIFWGTADCSNDAIFAAVDPPVRVPEPVSLALFGTSVLGLGAFARRRRKA